MPETRMRNYRANTPPTAKRREFDTPRKAQFYHDYDMRLPGTSIRQVERNNDIRHATAARWLKERQILGSPARRRSRKRSSLLGPHFQVSKEQCQDLINPDKNPVRDQQYEAQIKYHNIRNSNTGQLVHKSTIQRSLCRETKNAKRYKQAYIQKKLLEKNQKERVKYGNLHITDDIDDWKRRVFTDEAHIDPSSQCQGYILREEGTRYTSENIQQRGELKGVRWHIAAWISWDRKAEKLEFYNNEWEGVIKPGMPRKPRQTMYEGDEEFSHRLKEWEAKREHEKELKPKGNGMTQEYYVNRLLPVYIKAVHQGRALRDGNWELQEDGDPSHGTKKRGLAEELKEKNWIVNLTHPAQSPDLNPMEAIWNILKQRFRRRVWRTEEDAKVIVCSGIDFGLTELRYSGRRGTTLGRAPPP